LVLANCVFVKHQIVRLWFSEINSESEEEGMERRSVRACVAVGGKAMPRLS
jgi:hypothetical protein